MPFAVNIAEADSKRSWHKQPRRSRQTKADNLGSMQVSERCRSYNPWTRNIILNDSLQNLPLTYYILSFGRVCLTRKKVPSESNLFFPLNECSLLIVRLSLKTHVILMFFDVTVRFYWFILKNVQLSVVLIFELMLFFALMRTQINAWRPLAISMSQRRNFHHRVTFWGEFSIILVKLRRGEILWFRVKFKN